MTLFSYVFFGDDEYDDGIYTTGVVAATDKKSAEEIIRKHYETDLGIINLNIECLHMQDKEFIAEIGRISR